MWCAFIKTLPLKIASERKRRFIIFGKQTIGIINTELYTYTIAIECITGSSNRMTLFFTFETFLKNLTHSYYSDALTNYMTLQCIY